MADDLKSGSGRTAPSDKPDLVRSALAEFIGTALLLMAIVGSGIMAQGLTEDVGLQLTINIVSTGTALGCLVLTFISVSGAHFNPAVTLVEVLLGNKKWSWATAYVGAQFAGSIAGVVGANLMFDLDAVQWSTKDRSGSHLLVAEAVATLGLMLVIHGVSRKHGEAATALSVAAFIASAFAFTSSTSFANPAVTLARTMSDTFAGIRPGSAPGFMVVQLFVAVASVPLLRFLFPPLDASTIKLD